MGLVAIAIGVLTQPSSAELDEQSLIGQDLTKDFDSPDEAKRLKIVRFDEDTATLRDFEVAEHDGLWTIPSKDGYPADAAPADGRGGHVAHGPQDSLRGQQERRRP